MAETDALYQTVGRKIRAAREGAGRKLSQDKLAKLLGVSRASIVNIEAGRQHAPLHLLWQIAEALGTDLVLLLPRREEMLAPEPAIPLDGETLRQIERIAGGNPDAQKQMAGLISRLKTSIETTPMSKDTP